LGAKEVNIMTDDDTKTPRRPSALVPDDPGPGTGDDTGLRGDLGATSLVMTVIAYNGPIIILASFVPVVISFGNGLGAPAMYLFLGILVAIFAVGINAMAPRMGRAGAFYTYITAGLGRPQGLAAGLIAIVAYMCTAAGTLPILATSVQHLLTNVFGIAGGGLPWQFWAVAFWVVIAALSLFNIGLSAKVLGACSCAEIVLAVVWNFRVYLDGGPEGRGVDVLGNVFSGAPAFTLVLAILCLTGFESLQVFRSETKDTVRTVPRATYISVALLTGMYTISSYAFIVSYGASKVIEAGAEDATGSFLASVARYVAKPAADVANILLTTSCFAAILAITNILARYLFALGRDGVLPARLGRANHRFGSPMNSAAVASTLILVSLAITVVAGMSAQLTFATLTSFGGYCLVLLYFFTSIAIVVFFAKRRDAGVNRWRSTVAPLIACVGMGAVLYLSTVNFAGVLGQSQTVATVILLVVLGLIAAGMAWAVALRSRRPDVYAGIGNQAESTSST
jgi:amino acid transporter